jgi:hypothetical protein
MESSIVAVLLLIATLALALGVFAFYSVSFSNQYSSVSEQEYLIGVSKLIGIEVSQPTYAGIPPDYNYFNVSYVIWIQSPLKTVTIVAFVTSLQPNPSYVLPSNAQNASLFASSLNGYSSLRPFNLNATVYLPQGGQPLGNIHVVAYNVTSNSTYVLSAVLRPSQIIMLWFLYYYDGKWYRLDYVYLSPFSSGIGVYIISGSGVYKGYNGTLSNPTPYIYIGFTGFQIGMWFKVINVQESPTPLLNVTFIPTDSNSGKKFSVILYTKGPSAYVNISGTVRLLYNNLKVGQPYLITFTSPPMFLLGPVAEIRIYNEQGDLLTSSIMGMPLGLNKYVLVFTFGSKTISNGIYQAFFVTSHNPTTPIDSLFLEYLLQTVIQNGPLYNNTYLFNWTAMYYPRFSAVAYWYFVWPYNNPPNQLPGLLWYWPSGGSNYPDIYYIPENGTNTYVIG